MAESITAMPPRAPGLTVANAGATIGAISGEFETTREGVFEEGGRV